MGKAMIIKTIMIIGLLLISQPVVTQKASAQVACTCTAGLDCTEVKCLHEQTRSQIKKFIDKQFETHEEWFEEEWWEKNLLPALMYQAEQLSTARTQSVQQEVQLQEARIEQETQTEIQAAQTGAAIKYGSHNPETCSLVTATAGLAAAEQTAKDTQTATTQTLVATATDENGTPGTQASFTDAMTRVACNIANPQNGGGAMEALCEDQGGIGQDGSEGTLSNILAGGEIDPEGNTGEVFTGMVQAMFGSQPTPTITTAQYTPGTSVSLLRSRGAAAKSVLAGHCFASSFSDQTSSTSELGLEQRRALLTQIGLSEEEAERMSGTSQHSQMQSAIMQLSQPKTAVGFVAQPNNILTQINTIDGLRLSVLHDILIQQHCNELMSSVILATELEPKMRDVSQRLQTAWDNYNSKSKQTDFAQK